MVMAMILDTPAIGACLVSRNSAVAPLEALKLADGIANACRVARAYAYMY